MLFDKMIDMIMPFFITFNGHALADLFSALHGFLSLLKLLLLSGWWGLGGLFLCIIGLYLWKR